MNILITGAAGLLGSELVRQVIDKGWSVGGVDLSAQVETLSRCKVVTADLRDRAACRDLCAGFDTVVHTAAVQHHDDPPKLGRERFFRQNVEMTRHCVDAAEEKGVRHFVLISSDMVYGIPRLRPFRETDTPLPIGPYGQSKLESERLCEAKCSGRMTVTILRPRLIVGPGRLGILTKLFDRIRAGKRVPLIGDGTNRYQMVAVSDVARAVICALEKSAGATFNLGSSEVPTVKALMEGLARSANSPSRVLRTPRRLTEAALWTLHAFRVAPLVPEQFRIAGVDYVLDTTAARQQLGWAPRFTDEEMLWQAYQQYVAAA